MTSDLDNLEDKIDKASAQDDMEVPEVSMGGNVRAGAEFISPMLGGLLLGYFLDKWLDTAPIFLISLFLMGVAGGFIGIYRASLDSDAPDELSRLHKPGKDAKTSAKDRQQE